MYNANALKIGIFGANCSSGRSATKVPEPGSLPVFAAGCVLAALALRRRNRGQTPNLGN